MNFSRSQWIKLPGGRSHNREVMQTACLSPTEKISGGCWHQGNSYLKAVGLIGFVNSTEEDAGDLDMFP